MQELDAAGSPAPGSSCAAIVPQLGAMGLGCTDDLGAIGLSGASACDMCCDTCGAEACGVSTRRAYPAGHGDSYVVGCPRVEWTSDYAVKKKEYALWSSVASLGFVYIGLFRGGLGFISGCSVGFAASADSSRSCIPVPDGEPEFLCI